MAVYYPLFAEPFDITQEPPLHTAIIADLVASYHNTATTAETLESTSKSLPATLDEILRRHLRTDRNIAVAKRTKIGIVYQDLIARANNVSCLQDYLTHLLTGHFPTKTKCASAMGTGKSNLSRDIPYNKLINWLGGIGYRVGHVESYYDHNKANKARELQGQPIVDDHIRDLTTRELQLIKIGSALGSLAASTPATSLGGSMLKIKEMALTCADLLSEVISIPDEPLDYHNNFFHIVNDIVNASCQVSLPNPANPDCRFLLQEEPLAKISKNSITNNKIASIFEKWPFTTSRLLIEQQHRKLLHTKLMHMDYKSCERANGPDATKSLVSNQHSMISRALAELQYLAVFLRISENATDDTLIRNAIYDMGKKIAKMEDHAPGNPDQFIIEDLGFHEVIPRLVANYSEGQFNPMNLERFVQILHESAFNRTRSRLSTLGERMAIVEDHNEILAALKLYRSDKSNSSKSAERKAGVVDCLSRHLYLALNTETMTEDEISGVARDSVSDAIKLFGLTAGSFTHQATSLWTDQGAKRMLFVSDYQLPREMLGGDESDPTKQDLNIVRFIIALYKLHKIVSNAVSAENQPFIFIFHRKKGELDTLFPINSDVRNAAIKYYSMHERIMKAGHFELERAFANAKEFYRQLISSIDFSRSKPAGAELSETDKALLQELKNNRRDLDAVLERIKLSGDRSLIGPYHKPGGAVAWIQGQDNEIFRTKRVSASGAITQDIWGGDEDLRFLIDICTSIKNKGDGNQSGTSGKSTTKKKKDSPDVSPTAGQHWNSEWTGLAASILISFSLLNGGLTELTQYVAKCGHNFV